MGKVGEEGTLAEPLVRAGDSCRPAAWWFGEPKRECHSPKDALLAWDACCPGEMSQERVGEGPMGDSPDGAGLAGAAPSALP